ncbi:MAG: hypothetical protein ACWA41_05280 [Putridiphycobacter sp.]
MEKRINLKSDYNSLENVLSFLKSKTNYDCSLDYDIWDLRTDANGQMEKCVVIKKSNMHGAKAYITPQNELSISYIIPNKVMNAYFGKSQKARKGILDIVAGGIKNIALAGSQKKAFEEISSNLDEIKA